MNDEVADEMSTVALSKCTEKDVLLGRGNRNNAWPGNVHFRNVAMKYRDEYSNVNRCQKAIIALKVIDEIKASGGRFVQVDHDAFHCSRNTVLYCLEVDRARSIKKNCQVLREKISSKHKPSQLYREKIDDPITALHDGNNGIDSTVLLESNTNTGDIPLPNSDSITSRCNDLRCKESKANRAKFIFCEDEMLTRLRCFQAKYGHANVPLNWGSDIVLADWCSVQRQLYRELQSGNIPPSSKEGAVLIVNDPQSKLFEELNAMNFSWDYDSWHWNHWYSRLVARSIDDPAPPSLKAWLRDQRRRYQKGTLPADRLEKLNQVGFSML